ncbi:MAG TPA: group 1 truncated hemoglobin [Gemmataceae bacterium]|nr:group 1 truncated hemoglobin [Gemmataceae bacterium]
MHTSLRWRQVVLAACLLAFGAAGTAVAADDKPTDKSDKGTSRDKQISEVLKDIHNRGAELYNTGRPTECYRMFQGALLMVQPMLDHHPKVQKIIEDGLAKADTNPSMKGRALALHELIEDVRSKIKAGGKKSAAKKPDDKASGDKEPSGKLWDRLGGDKTVRQIVEDAVRSLANDPKVDFTRGGKYKLGDDEVFHLQAQMIDLISQATGGPHEYKGKSMKEAHKGMGITDAQFDASVADLAAALKKNKVPADAARDFLKIVERTRKDIVEPKKSGGDKQGDKEPKDKKPGDKTDKNLGDKTDG